MKKFALVLAVLCAFNAMLCAGPESIPSGKEMKEVAPMPPACPSWTGFYVGGFGGYKFAATDIDTDFTGAFLVPNPNLGNPADSFFINSKIPDNLDTSGAELGGVLGYNYQLHNWVFGLEGSGGYLWLRDSDNTGDFISPRPPGSGDTFKVSTSFKTHYLTTVGPRIGYAFCRWLPYVTGGLAVGDIDFDQMVTQEGPRGGLGLQGGSTSETKVGWMAGGGLQYAITNHLSVRGQYQYVDLGCTDFHSLFTNRAGLVFSDFTARHEACLREHNASFAIIYGF